MRSRKIASYGQNLRLSSRKLSMWLSDFNVSSIKDQVDTHKRQEWSCYFWYV